MTAICLNNTELLILVVEDDDQLRAALAQWLGERGFFVAVASDCASGINQAISLRPHAILLDLRLPDGSGLELLRTIRGAGIATPFVVLTGSDSPCVGFELAQVGAAKVIEKPSSADEIAAALRAVATSGSGSDPFGEIQSLLSEWSPTDSNFPERVLSSLAAQLGNPCLDLIEFAFLAPLVSVVRTDPTGFATRLSEALIEVTKIRATAGDSVLSLLSQISRAPAGENERLGRTLHRQMRNRVHIRTGRRPSSWIRLARLRRAFHELVRTDEQVAQVAHRLGFARGGQLTRDIQTLVGLSPTVLRRGARKNGQQIVNF